MNDGREYRYQVDWQFQGQMYHVRCDDWEIFKEAKANMEAILPKENAFPDDVGEKMATPTGQVQKSLGTCKKCGSPNALSKSGNVYCSAKCWLKEV